MFCPNCGKEVKDGDMFCGECGAKVTLDDQTEPLKEEVKKEPPKKAAPEKKAVKQAVPKQRTQSKPKSNGMSPRAKKIIAIQVAVLAVLVGVFYYFGSRSSSPESAANQFVEDYNNKEWTKIYDLYNFDEDTFINEDAFEKTMDQSKVETLTAPTGGQTSASYSSSTAAPYVYRAKKGSDYVIINVAKSAKKNFLFFDKYEVTGVVDSGVMTTSVRVPNVSGITMKIDGIKAKAPSDTTGTSYYTRMFSGTHKVTFEGADGLFEKDSYSFDTKSNDLVSQIKYSSKSKSDAAQALRGYLPAITEARIKNSGTSSLNSYFSSEQKASIYGTSLCRYTYYSGSDAKSLGSVNITKCEAVASTSSYYTFAEGIPVSVSGTRDYQYKTWSGSYQKQTCTISGVAKMIKQNGKWVIDSVSYYYY